MTLDQLSPEVIAEVQSLSRIAKQEILALANNSMTIISGRAQLIVDDDRAYQVARAGARVINRTTAMYLDDLKELLGLQRDHNGALGASRE